MSGSASRASIYEKMLLRNKNTNKEASLVGKISSFNYFESVYSPEVTANLIFLDASGSIKADKSQDIQERLGTIKSSLPIVGEEDLEVLIRSEKSGRLNFTKKPLRVNTAPTGSDRSILTPFIESSPIIPFQIVLSKSKIISFFFFIFRLSL